MPPELLNNDPKGYAWTVWHDRTPRLLAQTADAHPYDAGQRQALAALWDEVSAGRIEPLPAEAHDAGLWASWADGHVGERWSDPPFLWSESYFYRRLLDAVGYFAPGPWRGVDPFAFLKNAELHTQAAQASLAAFADLRALPRDEQVRVKLLAALWGNRADLGFRIGRDPHAAVGEELILDDSADVLAVAARASRIILVADNAGQELLADLVLADHVLADSETLVLELHVKPHPYYVSDATMTDVAACVDQLARTAASSDIAVRLKAAAAAGRLVLWTHDFYCAPLEFARMPDDLRARFASASLTIMKGDLNYRRLVGDRAWPPQTPFADTVAYFPGAVAALRTLKSDVAVGISSQLCAALDGAALDGTGAWRTDGNHGLIQARLPAFASNPPAANRADPAPDRRLVSKRDSDAGAV